MPCKPANDDIQFSRSRVISAPDENAVVVERLFRFSFPRGAKARDPGMSKVALRGQRFKMKMGCVYLRSLLVHITSPVIRSRTHTGHPSFPSFFAIRIASLLVVVSMPPKRVETLYRLCLIRRDLPPLSFRHQSQRTCSGGTMMSSVPQFLHFIGVLFVEEKTHPPFIVRALSPRFLRKKRV